MARPKLEDGEKGNYNVSRVVKKKRLAEKSLRDAERAAKTQKKHIFFQTNLKLKNKKNEPQIFKCINKKEQIELPIFIVFVVVKRLLIIH